ncbi:hypothetical protein KC340_g146 [Hortaea werneckii]|nr:hypothetical protein KC340_g146 [Hortaea werneckii]
MILQREVFGIGCSDFPGLGGLGTSWALISRSSAPVSHRCGFGLDRRPGDVGGGGGSGTSPAAAHMGLDGPLAAAEGIGTETNRDIPYLLYPSEGPSQMKEPEWLEDITETRPNFYSIQLGPPSTP